MQDKGVPACAEANQAMDSAAFQQVTPNDIIANLEKKLESLQGPCQRSDCQRARALLRERPPVQYSSESIERVRSKRMGAFWVLSVMAAFFWIIVCIQKKHVLLAVANFGLAFLPLWRHLYVDTPFYTRVVAWITIAGTFALMLRSGGD
jgi:hypothetical protein